ncbi:NAD-binding protein [Rhodobacteraceae bacterium KN286]|uniref:NAD-binding protein n=2 Tax=Oceanomicrobium pacificus TaxID=2692916 RepID=A0A6B0U522_9RHOB|nr:NAD-binding protein [Oceanomicrobium pacificus]
MARVGFLGLGKMGSGMAARLVAAGHEVTVWNRDAAKCAVLAEAGAQVADTPAGAARGAEFVLSMVADDAASTRVWTDADGALPVMEAGAVACECSTISHGQVARLAAAASARGIGYIDCPVNGPPTGAAAGTLVLLVGADPVLLDRARPVLEPLAASILHFGAVGSGTGFKLLNNLLGAVHVAAIAEVAHLAGKLELDPETLIAAVESGPCASPHTVRMIRAMAHGKLSDQTGLAIGLREKDARYCLAMARENGTGMSVGETAYSWYADALGSVAAEDDSAMLRVVTARNGHAPAVPEGG